VPREVPLQQTPQQPQDMNSEMLASRIEATRTHLAALAAAGPRLPHEAGRAADLLSRDLQGRSTFDVVLLVLGFLSLPGEQFVIRRALALIKQAFDANDIRFAVPTVQVAGRNEAEPAAAQQALKLIKTAPPE
jgi:moderate conductance mechanosensitive channel